MKQCQQHRKSALSAAIAAAINDVFSLDSPTISIRTSDAQNRKTEECTSMEKRIGRAGR